MLLVNTLKKALNEVGTSGSSSLVQKVVNNVTVETWTTKLRSIVIKTEHMWISFKKPCSVLQISVTEGTIFRN